MTEKDKYLFTSESVSEGHPDKVCDRISDCLLDLYLSKDENSRVAIETMATTNKVFIAGEVKSKAEISNSEINNEIRKAIKDIGYEQDNFHWSSVEIINNVHTQSTDIAMGVDNAGAGDQGIMFGYAKDEDLGGTYENHYMPAAISLSHRILENMARDRKAGKLLGILPDSKSQVSLEYQNGKAVRAEAVVVSTQHVEELSQAEVKEMIRPYVLDVLPEGWMCDEDKFFVNPTGKFVIGGPDGDTGLTGRKIIVDTYGGYAPHGGGAFSGKDSTKVDRSAAYASRYLAKNIVAAGIAKECLIQLSYAIGVAQPLSIFVDCNNTATVDESEIERVLSKVMDLSPRGIIKHLKLNKPIFSATSAYGHFGRDAKGDLFTWEKTDLVEKIKKSL